MRFPRNVRVRPKLVQRLLQWRELPGWNGLGGMRGRGRAMHGVPREHDVHRGPLRGADVRGRKLRRRTALRLRWLVCLRLHVLHWLLCGGAVLGRERS